MTLLVPVVKDMECINEACGWTGPLEDCVYLKNDYYRKPFCPECHEVVEEVISNSADGSPQTVDAAPTSRTP